MNTDNTLEFNMILETLGKYALSQKAKEKLLVLKPFLSERECKSKMQETTEERKMLEGIGTPPLAQSGLHVPVSQGSVFCMHNSIFCDIGDGQSISENLSTFSSHIKNIVAILRGVSGESCALFIAQRLGFPGIC